jgi:hypothetical protein
VGRHFRDLHPQLDQIVADTVSATTALPGFPVGERSTREVA